MRFLRLYRSLLIFAVLLVLCSVMVVRQINANQRKHMELREAFILLDSRGDKRLAEHLYQRLLMEMEKLPDTVLLDDFQRTRMLVDPTKQQSENLIWKYHWTVSNEMEKRSVTALIKARKLAEEK